MPIADAPIIVRSGLRLLLEATRQIKARQPQVQVLVLTMHRSDEYFFNMLASAVLSRMNSSRKN